ncbi:MAG: ATP-binding protein [Betaproteobacteria bacterium]
MARNDRKKSSNYKQIQRLVEFAGSQIEYFKAGGQTFGRIKVDDHFEQWPLNSDRLSNRLRHLYRTQTGEIVNSYALSEAIKALVAEADCTAPDAKTYVRTAPGEGCIYIDLCNENWEAVKITRDGWQVVKDHPVLFNRPPHLLPLPQPVEGGVVEDLWQFIDGMEISDFIVLAALITWWLTPWKCGYPILNLIGGPGTGKSTLAKMLVSLIDPVMDPLKTLPRNEEQLVQIANGSWVLAFDNVSKIDQWLSNSLCKVSTGIGMQIRELYTTDIMRAYHIARPVIITSVKNVVTARDLRSRTITIPLSRIEKRRTATAIEAAFAETTPRILGFLCSAIAQGLKRFEAEANSADVESRMADFEVWGSCVEEAVGFFKGDFLKAWTYVRSRTLEDTVRGESLIPLARQLLKEHHGSWKGTTKQMLAALRLKVSDDDIRGEDWLNSEKKLSCEMKRILPCLRDLGIEYEEAGRSQNGATLYRLYELERPHGENMLDA